MEFYLITGAISILEPFTLQTLTPERRNSLEKVRELISQSFKRLLKQHIYIENVNIPEWWDSEPCIEDKYSIYVKRENNNLLYFLDTKTFQCKYIVTSFTPDGQIVPILDSVKPFFWKFEPHPDLFKVCILPPISAGRYNQSPTTTFEAAYNLVPSDDPITLMFISYIMMRYFSIRAYFLVDNGTLYLESEFGYESPIDQDSSIPDGRVEYPWTLYQFSERYRDLPISKEGVEMLFPGEGESIVNGSIDTSRRDSKSQHLLNRIISKIKLCRIMEELWGKYPYSIEDT